LNTLIGAVPGAMPPVIGWTAVRGQLDIEAVFLFLILFIWQVPHFLAIAWMYREQYAAAGYKMLTIDDETGVSTGRQMLLYFAALVPVTLMAANVFGAGRGYAIGAIVLAIYWLRSMILFRRQPDESNARHVLRASIVYLPALLALLVMTKQSMNF
jgi:protoheme IX farnesyltransferase